MAAGNYWRTKIKDDPCSPEQGISTLEKTLYKASKILQVNVIIVISKFTKDIKVVDYGVGKIITFKFHTVRKITVITMKFPRKTCL